MKGKVVGLSLLLAVTMITAQEEPKIICLYSKELRNGMDFNAFCTLTKPASVDVSVFVSIRETQETTSDLAFTGSMFTITIGAGNLHGSGKLPISYDLPTGASYFIHSSFSGLSIKPWSEQINGYRPELPYFIITDKPVYKPGDDVLIRGLTCDMYLKPTSASATIEIKDSKKNTIMKETSTDDLKNGFPTYVNALIDTNFTLSDDPLTGMYTVSLYTDEGYVERQFEVKEFVLPRFEVKIELHKPYLVSGENEIKGVIKGIYSYGKNVQGRAQIKSRGSFGLYDDKKIAWNSESPFDGRAEFTVKVNETNIQMPWFRDYYASSTTIYLQGEVIEANSNDVQSVEASVTIYPTDFTAKLGPMPLLFKGNPQYTFPVSLTDPVGGMLTDYNGYTLYYKAYDDKEFSVMKVNSNPMTVTVKMNTSDTNLNSNQVEVYFSKDKVNSPRVRQEVTKYYTWSNTTLKIELVTSQSKDERCFKLTPFSAGDIAYYQVVNNYYAEDIKQYEISSGYCLQVQQKHAPKTRLLAYKMVPYTDGKTTSEELITAYLDIHIDWSPEQKVELEVTSKSGQETVKPGEEVEINVKTNGKAIVGLKGVDKRLSFMADQNDVTEKELENAVARQRSFDRKKENPNPNPPIFPMPFLEREAPAIGKKRCSACIESDKYMDPRKMIQESGQVIVTNIDLKRQDGFDFSRDIFYDVPVYYAMEADAMRKGDEDINPNLGDRFFLAMAGQGGEEGDKSVAEFDEVEKSDTDESMSDEDDKERNNFPDTWLWDIILTSDEGMYKNDVTVPDSITNWEVTAFGFNNADGLSVSEKKEITVFQQFFISMYLPYSVVQSERVTIDILVFNYLDTQLTVTVELAESTNYTIADTSIFNNGITISPGSSGVQRVLVTFDKVGDIPLRAIAKDVNNNNNQDIVVRTLIVKPKGREMRDDTSLVVDVSTNTDSEVYFNISNFFQTPGYVPNSLRMYLYTTGDMMGTFIGLIVEKIKMPFGCGEQNIKSLTPSVVIARYLTKLKRLDEKTKGLLKKVCGAGVRKEFNYLHRDGSYSAFGEKPNMCVCGSAGTKFGSTWLTAYVLMSFSLLYSDEITYIDPKNLMKSFDYINNNATVKDCSYQYFIEKGELIHTEMKGISSTRFGFTSFVTIAVMDYRLAALKAGLTDSAEKAQKLRDGAVGWLKSHKEELLTMKEPYQLAIVAYALARANTVSPDVDSSALLETLENVLAGKEKSIAENGECVYSPTSGESKSCRTDADCGNEYMECCMVPCSNGMKKCSRKPYRPIFRDHQMSDEQSPSKSIEMNGYRMMAYLFLYDRETNSDKKTILLKKIDNLKEWLLSKRKGNGFFESTQDTVVALRALATYAMTFPNKQGAEFTVTAKVNGKVVTEEVVVTDDAYTIITEEKLDVSSLPTAVTATVTGSKGVAYLNLVALYNVDKNVTTKPYLINIEPRNKKDKSLMRVCFKRNPDFTGDIGSMVTVQMETQTGINILNVVPENERDPSFSPEKYEYNKESSILDVYYMVNSNPLDEERCLHVSYELDFIVENVQPKEIRVANYYSPEVASSVLYNVNPADAIELTERETTTVTIGASAAHINILLLICTILVVMFSIMLQSE